MTKKDYELVASSIKYIREFGRTRGLPQADDTSEDIARQLMYALHKRNPRFNKPKFLTACGIKHVHHYSGIVHYPDGHVIVCIDCGEAKD